MRNQSDMLSDKLRRLDLHNDIDYLVCNFSSFVLGLLGMEAYSFVFDYVVSEDSMPEKEKGVHLARGMVYYSNGLPFDILSKYLSIFTGTYMENTLHALVLSHSVMVPSQHQIFFKPGEYYDTLDEFAKSVVALSDKGWLWQLAKAYSQTALKKGIERKKLDEEYKAGRIIIPEDRIVSTIDSSTSGLRDIGYTDECVSHIRECVLIASSTATEVEGKATSSLTIPSLIEFCHKTLRVNWNVIGNTVEFVNAHILL